MAKLDLEDYFFILSMVCLTGIFFSSNYSRLWFALLFFSLMNFAIFSLNILKRSKKDE